MRALAGVLCLLLLGRDLVGAAGKEGVRLGRQQVQDGDPETALITLDVAARQLAQDGGQPEELAQAYLFMGVAYVGLRQDVLAKARFVRAIALDPSVELPATGFPPRVRRVLEEARREQEGATTAGLAAKKGHRGKGLALLGAGAAAAIGAVFLTTRGDPANAAPTVPTVTVSPEGTALKSATELTLVAAASDPDGEPLTFAWTLPLEVTLYGPTARYTPSDKVSNGRQSLSVTAKDPAGATATGTASFDAGDLAGTWLIGAGERFKGETAFRLGSYTDGSGFGEICVVDGSGDSCHKYQLSHPRNVDFLVKIAGDCVVQFTGTANSGLRLIGGTAKLFGSRTGCKTGPFGWTLLRQ